MKVIIEKKLFWLVVLIALIVLINELYTDRSYRNRASVSNEQRLLQLKGSYDQSERVDLQSNYVSIAHIKESYYVIANYQNLLLFDRKNNEICLLEPNNFTESEKVRTGEKLANAIKNKTIAKYVPTGVAVGHSKRLYVANYKANNILVGTIDITNCRVVFDKTISSPHALGPENVAIDESRDFIASANYDAGTITAFQLSTGELLWSTDIGQAHGVSIVGDVILATGLKERKVYEVELSSGKILRSIGQIGWEPLKGEFLWPTTIYPINENMAVISDAQTGYISFLDLENFIVYSYLGGYGPTYKYLNYPYAAVPANKELMVLSSQRGHILFMNETGEFINEEYYFKKDNWPNKKGLNEPFRNGWRGYIKEYGTPLEWAEQRYKLGFAHLHPVQPGPTLVMPDTWSFVNGAGYIYFLQGDNLNSEIAVFFSSSSPTLLAIVDRPPDPVVLTSIKIPLDSWLVNKQIVSVDGVVATKEQLINRFYASNKKVKEALKNNDWLNKYELYQIGLFNHYENPDQSRDAQYKTYLELLDEVYVSYAGREFKHVYDQCEPNSCCISCLKSAAHNYYFEMQNSPYANIDEYYLVGMLSGVRGGAAERGDDIITFENCESSHYYEGYGYETLITPSLEDYLSSPNKQSSSVCLRKNDSQKNSLLKELKFGWYSQNEIPRRLNIYGINNEDDVSKKRLIYSGGNFTARESGGYLFSTINFNHEEIYDSYEIELVEGGDQDRMLLRSITGIFANDLISNKHDRRKRYKYTPCDSGQYLDGYGLEALETRILGDYLSASTKHTSKVCIELNSSDTTDGINKLEFGWFSKEEVPKKLQVYGFENSKETSQAKLLEEFKELEVEEIGGYLFSTIKLISDVNYKHYMINVVEGGEQDRLLLRSLNPIFNSNKKDLPLLDRIAYEVSTELNYGKGIKKLAKDTEQSAKAVIEEIINSESAHCGNFAIVFASKLPEEVHWTVFDLKAMNGNIHTVVEVKQDDQYTTYDPTIGVAYACRTENMLKGTCEFSNERRLKNINPVFDMYTGKGFYYGAKILDTTSTINELAQQYFHQN